jgi:hypothetical protein
MYRTTRASLRRSAMPKQLLGNAAGVAGQDHDIAVTETPCFSGLDMGMLSYITSSENSCKFGPVGPVGLVGPVAQ